MSSSNLVRLRAIKDYLKSKLIPVSEQWLTSQLVANSSATNEAVYQNWLNSDIKTTVTASDGPPLPTDCNQIKVNEQTNKPIKVTLRGYYALQINSIEDISRPKAQTTADILDDVSASEESADEEQTQTKLFKKKGKSDPKKKVVKSGPRMLSMVLTDGITNCKAVEYQPITSLNIDTPIGTKLLITGPVDVYTAVMFLTETNVKLLGGSIPMDTNEVRADGRTLRTLFPQTSRT